MSGLRSPESLKTLEWQLPWHEAHTSADPLLLPFHEVTYALDMSEELAKNALVCNYLKSVPVTIGSSAA